MLDCEYGLNESDLQNISGDITQKKIRIFMKRYIKGVLDNGIVSRY